MLEKNDFDYIFRVDSKGRCRECMFSPTVLYVLASNQQEAEANNIEGVCARCLMSTLENYCAICVKNLVPEK